MRRKAQKAPQRGTEWDSVRLSADLQIEGETAEQVLETKPTQQF
jgi:hypothetical protein